MGANCANLRESNQERKSRESISREKKKKKLEIEVTGIVNIDKIFEQSKEILAAIAVQKKKFKSVYKRLKSATKVKMLKDPQIEDVMMAMLFIYSAGSRGDLESLGLEITEESPYLRVDELSLRNEYKDIASQWNFFIKELNMINPIIIQLSSRLEEESKAVQVVPELAKEVSTSLKTADRVTFNEAVYSNLVKINNAPKIIAHTLELEAEIKQRLSVFVHGKLTANGGLKQFQDIGRQAHHASVFDPKKIIMTYWPEEDRIS